MKARVWSMYFSWKDEYSVNNETIDSQHKKLFKIGRTISNIIFSEDPSHSNEELVCIICDLRNYTEFHFKYEEKLLKEKGYPHYATHKHEHEMIIERMNKIGNNGSEAVDREKLMELINFVLDWISNHILETDKKYSSYLKP